MVDYQCMGYGDEGWFIYQCERGKKSFQLSLNILMWGWCSRMDQLIDMKQAPKLTKVCNGWA